jgi:LmbE family N-acetylglucosaminyl deacetylase
LKVKDNFADGTPEAAGAPYATIPRRMALRSHIRHLYRTLLPLLYAKSRYKLFLNATFEHISLRTLMLASQSDYFAEFVRPVPIHAPFGTSMVVVAPHQDDEAIGCGGAMALQARAGKAVSIILMQDGADGYDELGYPSRQAMSAIRNEESRQAAAVIGLEPPRFLGHASLKAAMPAATEDLRNFIEDKKADAIFIPMPLDANPDHRIANYILADALRTIPRTIRVFAYEVWGLCVPNVIVVIDDVIEEKMQMLQRFEFANTALDYTNSTKGLNMYRSRLLGSGMCRYAECFFELPREEYIELSDRVRSSDQSLAIPPAVAAAATIS